MTDDDIPRPTVPAWLVALLALLCAPLAAMPWLISNFPPLPEARLLLTGYPAAVVLGALCAAVCWRRRRVELTWILVAVIILMHLAMWLTTAPWI